MNAFAYAILAAILLSGALGIYLLIRQATAVAASRGRVPGDFAGMISREDHERAADYTLARARLSIVETVFDSLTAILWLSVLLGPLYALTGELFASGLSRSVAVVVLYAIADRLLHLPFSLYRTFGLESRFGFNRTTPAIFLIDRIKGTTLAALLGIPLLYGLFWIIGSLPGLWWLIGWAGCMALIIAMTILYPTFIDPLFNKFTPLPENKLKARIEALLAKCGFRSGGLYVKDASRRSTHGNAYFSGFGKAKRIVFFDTLLENHTPDEILSILAHELGHYKLGHIWQRMAESALFFFAGFAFLDWAFTGGLARAFGLAADYGVILIAVLIIAEPILHLLSPLTSFLSRRAEYQADHFAKLMNGAEPMISALTKLSRDNLSTLTPDRIYALFYYSHPPVPLRIARLKSA